MSAPFALTCPAPPAPATPRAPTVFAPLPYQLGGFPCISADPPWLYEDLGSRLAPDYEGVPTADLCALPVASHLAAERGYLFMWATSSHLPDAFEVMRAWSYRYVSSLVWVKTTKTPPAPSWRTLATAILGFAQQPETPRDSALSMIEQHLGSAWRRGREGAPRPRIGGGHHVRLAHEYVLIGERGGMTAPLDSRDVPSVVFAPPPPAHPGQRRRHSVKPESFVRLFERLSPGPRIELFARRPRDGWAVYGNESDGVALERDAKGAA